MHVIPFASGYRQGFDIAVVSSKSASGMLCLPALIILTSVTSSL
jgi:hypothetical protein